MSIVLALMGEQAYDYNDVLRAHFEVMRCSKFFFLPFPIPSAKWMEKARPIFPSMAM
jgi:hypothetical protein